MITGRYCAVLAAAALSLALSAPARAGDDPDALLTTPVTPQILARGAEADAYAQGVQAYVWGYPLVRMERVARQYTDVPANNPPTSYRAPLEPDRLGARTGDGGLERHADVEQRHVLHERDRRSRPSRSSSRSPTPTTAITSSTSSTCGRNSNIISGAA